MICPRCGRKIDGSLCPYCDEPQIDDNTEEYLKRKNAYEKSLRSENREVQERGERKFKKKHAVAALIVIGAALTTAIITTHLPRSFNGRIYAGSEGKVSLINDGALAEVSGRIYSSEGKDVYAEVKEPEAISVGAKEQLKGYTASKNGEYFALSRLEDNGSEDKYSLYVWNKNGDHAKVLSQDSVITVRDVTDSGEVIFTTSPVLNDQWYTGEDTLHIYKVTGLSDGELTGEIKRVSASVQSFFIYEAASTLVCLEKDGLLFSCPGYDTENRIIIADGVTKALPEKGDEDNYFSPDAPGVNVNRSADLLAYLCDGIWTMTDTEARIALTLGAAGESAQFIYDDRDRVIYKAEGSELSRCIISDSGLTDWEALGGFEGEALWDAYESFLIFETPEGLLKKAGSAEELTICENEKGSTLKKIYNSGGYIYEADDGIYASKDTRSAPVRINGEVSGDIKRCAAYKGTIYLFAGDSLYSIDKNNQASFLCRCEGLYVV